VVVNTGDDISLFGLRICPDLDTVMYTLGGGIDEERGWGRQDESFVVREELERYGSPLAWFGLGARDLATHLHRTQLLLGDATLTEVTRVLCERWQPGATLLPMSDVQAETHVTVADPESGRRRAIHFQEWWIKHRAALPAQAITLVHRGDLLPAPGVLEAIAAADVVLLPPSNPVVSIGTVLQVQGVRDALRDKRVVGLSPIVGGAPVRGMADACLTAIGVETTAEAVGRHYGSDLLDGWLVDTSDAGAEVPGVEVRAVPLLMTDLDATAEMARAALDLALA
ncbi:MAG: 2-phospho-L-lactate transferase, partial [Frankiales bacterium]